MRSAPPPAHPGAICHHTTHHRRNDTTTAVPRVLSWRQPRARYRGVTARGKSSWGTGEMRPGNTGGEQADIDIWTDGKSNIEQHHYITKQNRHNNSWISFSIQASKENHSNTRNIKISIWLWPII